MKGRPKGSPNKATTVFRDRLGELGFSVPDQAVSLFFQCEDPKIKARMLELMSTYTFPKPKPIDEDGNTDETSKVPLMAISSEVLIEALRITQERKGTT